ncbi:MAG: SiaB family protein kinase [Bacteroidetes bacterium]|nr:SiaB family protein kinase [Bacteroidota bacterium]
MSDNTHNEKQYVTDQFRQLLDLFNKDQSVLLSHEGELSKEEISKLEGNVENIVSSLNIAKGPLKKIFFISVETLQNMLIHGHKNNEGHQANFFILSKNGVKINITSANLVSNNAIPALQKQIEVINSFDDEKALKAYYLEHLENNQLSDKGGAGLGFITIGMKSGNKLKTEFKKINDDYSMFLLTSTVSLE